MPIPISSKPHLAATHEPFDLPNAPVNFLSVTWHANFGCSHTPTRIHDEDDSGAALVLRVKNLCITDLNLQAVICRTVLQDFTMPSQRVVSVAGRDFAPCTFRHKNVVPNDLSVHGCHLAKFVSGKTSQHEPNLLQEAGRVAPDRKLISMRSLSSELVVAPKSRRRPCP